MAKSVVAEGRDSWFFITVDYTFGHSLEADASAAVLAAGGKVLGSVRHPLNTSDFSSYLLQAQASGAKVIAFANGGGDMVNATKQANEFGLTKSQSLVSLLVFITDVHSMELKAAQGLKFVTAFYWDRNDETRAWSKRFFERQQRMPTQTQASVYSAIRHYLEAIAAAGTDEAKAVMAKMRETAGRTISTPKTATSARTAGWCTTCISRRSRRRRNPPGRGTITRSSPPSRAIRLSGRCPKAAARWSRSIEVAPHGEVQRVTLLSNHELFRGRPDQLRDAAKMRRLLSIRGCRRVVKAVILRYALLRASKMAGHPCPVCHHSRRSNGAHLG